LTISRPVCQDKPSAEEERADVLTTEENLATISRDEQHAKILSAMFELLQSVAAKQ
jgi:hypothetical protein